MQRGTRIVAGRFKNRLVKGEGSQVRPMTAYIRKRLFDKLSDSIEAASVLDLFAGSGSVGFEALSRGCEKVLFVEKDRIRVKSIWEKAMEWNIKEIVTVVKADVLAFKWDSKFELVFVDPPYAFKENEKLAEKVIELSEKGGTVVWHTNKILDFPGRFLKKDFFSHGGKNIYFFEVKSE